MLCCGIAVLWSPCTLAAESSKTIVAAGPAPTAWPCLSSAAGEEEGPHFLLRITRPQGTGEGKGQGKGEDKPNIRQANSGSLQHISRCRALQTTYHSMQNIVLITLAKDPKGITPPRTPTSNTFNTFKNTAHFFKYVVQHTGGAAHFLPHSYMCHSPWSLEIIISTAWDASLKRPPCFSKAARYGASTRGNE